MHSCRERRACWAKNERTIPKNNEQKERIEWERVRGKETKRMIEGEIMEDKGTTAIYTVNIKRNCQRGKNPNEKL